MSKNKHTLFNGTMIKQRFLTGLVILLPVTITFLIIRFFLNLLTAPFETIILSLLDTTHILENGLWIFSRAVLLNWLSKALVIGFLVLLVLAVGLVGRWFIFKQFLALSDRIIHAIPLVNKIYAACKDVTSSVLNSQTSAFQEVVLLPFPTTNSLGIGLITSTAQNPSSSLDTEECLAVFIPGTPNPTVGFLVRFPKKDLIFLDISVEEALKLIVSCGSASIALKMK